MATFASNQLTAAHLAGRDIEPKLLITFICDKWDHTHLSGRNSLQHDADNALAFEMRGKGKGKGRWKDKRKERKKGLCVMNRLDPIEELYNMYSEEEDTPRIVEIENDGLDFVLDVEELADPYIDS